MEHLFANSITPYNTAKRIADIKLNIGVEMFKIETVKDTGRSVALFCAVFNELIGSFSHKADLRGVDTRRHVRRRRYVAR